MIEVIYKDGTKEKFDEADCYSEGIEGFICLKKDETDDEDEETIAEVNSEEVRSIKLC